MQHIRHEQLPVHSQQKGARHGATVDIVENYTLMLGNLVTIVFSRMTALQKSRTGAAEEKRGKDKSPNLLSVLMDIWCVGADEAGHWREVISLF